MKQKNKLLTILSILLMSIFLISTTCFGTLVDDFDKNITSDGNDTKDLKDIGEKVLGIIKVVGIIISVAMLMVIGVKYMMGSAEERAGYKKTMFPYAIGAVLIFASTQLADAIYSWAINI